MFEPRRMSPTDPRQDAERGVALCRRGEWDGGLALCEYAARVAICEPEAYLNLARTLQLMKKRGLSA